MKITTYLTQCDAGGQATWRPCPSTARLEKPARWRCEACSKVYGQLKAVSDE